MTESAKKDRAATTPQTEEEPLLRISSLSKPTAHIDIEFDGSGKFEPFHFVNLDAIGLRERTAIADRLSESFELGARSATGKLSKKDSTQYGKVLRELTLMILPKLTAKKMGDGTNPNVGLGQGHLADIAVAFFVSSGESVPNRIELTKRMQRLADSLPRPTGAKSSRASRRSTQARRRGRG